MTPPPETGIVLPGWAQLAALVLTALGILFGILAVTSEKFRGLMGTFGGVISDRQQRLDDRAMGRLEARGQFADARVADLLEQVAFLQKEVAALRAAHRTTAEQHAQDTRVLAAQHLAEREEDRRRFEDERAEQRREIDDLRSRLT